LAETAAQDLAEALKRREQLALDKIAQAEAQAIDEVRDAAVDLALKTTRELIASNLDDKRAQALIEGAIKELPQKLQ
ncbi:MAG: F0F1 ATP synthase subunit B, partial [Alphaproteobacteria bacterium]